jgi:UDP-2,4-diacetamido-2,4,6-trideoxy-beta-L-altropyranose hydrolase
VGEGTLLIRADASVALGTGHVMRCFALAQAWQEAGGKVVFAMVDPLPSVRERLLCEGMDVVPMESQVGSIDDNRHTVELNRRCDAAWVLVDGYHFGAAYQRDLKAAGAQILFVDDDGSSEHYAADLILNQNSNADESSYKSREPHTRLLLGSRYVLLRREFWRWQKWKREIPSLGRKVLITMGGTDPDNITALAIAALKETRIEGLEALVVVGGNNPHLESLERLAAECRGSVRLLREPANMPELMAWADLALTAAGGTLWELLCMGCSVLSFARNVVQAEIVSRLDDEGIVGRLGYPHETKRMQVVTALEELANSQERRARFCRLARQRIDGGGARRVFEALVSSGVTRL